MVWLLNKTDNKDGGFILELKNDDAEYPGRLVVSKKSMFGNKPLVSIRTKDDKIYREAEHNCWTISEVK